VAGTFSRLRWIRRLLSGFDSSVPHVSKWPGAAVLGRIAGNHSDRLSCGQKHKWASVLQTSASRQPVRSTNQPQFAAFCPMRSIPRLDPKPPLTTVSNLETRHYNPHSGSPNRRVATPNETMAKGRFRAPHSFSHAPNSAIRGHRSAI
jgi:hypothetical protein